jgi:hypothetical protein
VAIIPGEGTKIAIESATPGTYTDLGEVNSVTGPAPSVASVETTNLQSTRHSYRPSKVPESGEVSFQIKIDPNNATQQILTGLMDTPVVKNWKITWPDGMTTPANSTFAGFLTAYNVSGAELENNVVADITIKLTGAITRTPGV